MAAAEAVFLTGGGGFLGGHVARSLLAAGYRVRCLVREGGSGSPAPEGCEAVLGDLLHPGRLVRALDGCRYLVHAAAVYSFSPRDRALIRAVNVGGTAGLLEAAHQAGVEKAVVTSSSATVGSAPPGREATEDDAPRAGHAGSAYHASKLEQEQVARASRLPTVLVLPTMPIGAGDRRPTPTGRMVLDTLRGRMPAYPSGGVNVVAVEDVAEAHLLALRRGLPGRRYLLGGDNVSLRELLALIATTGGRRPPAIPIPQPAALGLGWADELRCRAGLGRRPVVPLEGVRMSSERMHVSWARARSELAYQPKVALAEAVRRAVSWYRDQGYAA